MEKLEEKYQQLQQASKTLEEGIRVFQQHAQLGAHRELSSDEKVLLFMLRDSVIQRFEYCYELLWKYCKLLLLTAYGVEMLSPRTVFRETVRQRILTLEESDELLAFVDTRNQTSHIYDAAMAEKASRDILKHHKILVVTIQKLDPKGNAA